MKTLKELSRYAFIIMALFLTACSEDDDAAAADDTTTAASGDEFVTAKVDGADFAAAQDPAVIVGATIDSGVLVVQGGTNNGETINITIQNYDGPGVYNSGDSLTNPNQMGYIILEPFAGWLNNFGSFASGGISPGTVEITSDADGVVEGTFTFTGLNGEDMTSKEITEGKFKANLD